jgi:DNA polymerase Ligase (LigD)
MPRFVVLFHETPAGYPRGTHYDLMLEQGDVLRTWALEALPAVGQTVPAEGLPDHRTAYLDFDGAIAGNRGSVSRCDAGEYEIVEETATRLVVRLRGAKLTGTIALAAHEDDPPHRWRVSLSAD